jgi:hypothetical protein
MEAISAVEVGFESFQTICSDGNVAAEENGFVYESLYLDFRSWQ